MNNPHPNDECECGDYRKDHVGGIGPCRHNKPRDLTHGYKDCTSFRLAFPHEGPGSRAAFREAREAQP
jgi:hypothetical protein